MCTYFSKYMFDNFSFVQTFIYLKNSYCINQSFYTIYDSCLYPLWIKNPISDGIVFSLL